MAYVSKISDYRYEVREKIKVPGEVDAKGKQKWRVKIVTDFRTELEAEAYVANYRVKNSVGEKVKLSQGKIKFSEVLTAYKSTQTAEQTQIRINAWVTKPEFKWLVDMEIGNLTYEEMDQYVEQRTDEDIKPNTINRELNIFSPCFNWAIKQYKLKHWSNPVEQCDRPKFNDKRDRTLTPDEKEKLYKACAESGSPMLLFGVQLAYTTGIRRGELTKMKWAHVVLDGDNSHINLPAEITKTKQARTVPVSRVALQTLQDIQAWQKVRAEREPELKKQRVSAEMFDLSFVLSGTTPTAIGQAFRRARAESKIVDFHFHDLRHCFTTNLAGNNTFDMLELSQITGHTDPRMLKRYYNPTGASLAARMNAHK